jgi:hypothetical protein
LVRSPGLVLASGRAFVTQNDMLVIKLVISGFDDVMMMRGLGMYSTVWQKKKEETSETLDT